MRRTRGATLVEYALGIALVAVVSVTAVEALQDDATDKLDSRGQSIGHPDESAVSTTSTTSSGGGSSTTSTSTTAPAYNPSFEVTCSGASGQRNECLFSLDPEPPSVPVWSIVPASGFDNAVQTGNDFSVRFTSAGTFSVRAAVDGFEYIHTIDCTQNNSGNIRCESA